MNALPSSRADGAARSRAASDTGNGTGESAPLPPTRSGRQAAKRGPHGLAWLFSWSMFLWPPLVIATLLLVVPQGYYVLMSLHHDLGLGRVASAFTLANYARVLDDPFYLRTMWLTFYLSVIATFVGLVLALPCAYLLARMRSRWASHLLTLLLMASFITLVVKVLGLSLLINREGLINHGLRALGLIHEPLQLTSNGVGVVIGLVQYTLPLLVMILISVIQTIPEGLEEAAEIHGASWFGMLRQVILPLARPGILNGALIAFNMNMGAFTSAVLLGGGKVLTLPLLIQQKIVQEVSYGTGATLSTLLLVFVLVMNALFALLMRHR